MCISVVFLLGYETRRASILEKIMHQKPRCQRSSGARLPQLAWPISVLQLLLPFFLCVKPLPIKSNVSRDINKIQPNWNGKRGKLNLSSLGWRKVRTVNPKVWDGEQRILVLLPPWPFIFQVFFLVYHNSWKNTLHHTTPPDIAQYLLKGKRLRQAKGGTLITICHHPINSQTSPHHSRTLGKMRQSHQLPLLGLLLFSLIPRQQCEICGKYALS